MPFVDYTIVCWPSGVNHEGSASLIRFPMTACLTTSLGFLPNICEKWSGFFNVHRVWLSFGRLGNEDKAPCRSALLPRWDSNSHRNLQYGSLRSLLALRALVHDSSSSLHERQKVMLSRIAKNSIRFDSDSLVTFLPEVRFDSNSELFWFEEKKVGICPCN